MRQCGDCKACCFTHGVPEIGKSHWQHCQHECSTGCAIYQQRPQSCRNFECLWLQGRFDVDDQPNKIGVVVVPGKKFDVCNTFVFHEVTPGAARQGRAKDLIDWMLRRNTSVIIVNQNGDRSVIPCSDAAKTFFERRVEERGNG